MQYKVCYKHGICDDEVSVSATSTVNQLLTAICKKFDFECASNNLLLEHPSQSIMDSIEDRNSQLLQLYLCLQNDGRPFSISESVLVINQAGFCCLF